MCVCVCVCVVVVCVCVCVCVWSSCGYLMDKYLIVIDHKQAERIDLSEG